MAYALVDLDRTSSGAPSNGLSTVSGYVSTAGNLIVGAGIYNHSSQLATAFSDTGGNTYAPMLDIYDATSGFGICVYYAKSIAGGTIDVTFKCGTGGTGTTPSGAKIGNAFAEFSGLHASAPFTTGETANNAQSSPGTAANALTSGNLPVLAVQPGLLFGIAFDAANAATPTEGTSPASTSIQNMWGFGSNNRGTMFHRRLTATTATAVTATAPLGGSDRHITIGVFLNETGAVVPGQPTGKRMGGVPFSAGDSSLFGVRRW